MSAMNVIRNADGLTILTDGACYDTSGVVQCICSKIIILPHLSAVVAARGLLSLLPALFEIAWVCRDFDELRSRIQENIHSLPLGPGGAEVVVAGYARDVFEIFMLPIHDIYAAEGYPFGVMTPVPGHLIQPSLDPAVAAQIGWRIPVTDLMGHAWNNFNVERDGLRLMECQRHDGNGGFLVGGFVQATVLTRSGISSSIIHTWPDQVGCRIEPVMLMAEAS
jgi:hypothetical protein